MTETSASRPPVHPPTETTIRANLAARERLPAETGEDFRDATRGLLGGLTEPIVTPTGTTVWDPKRWDFLEPEDSPNSVHPSLWRQARLNRIHGLFEVADGLYQARGYDIANITFVEGKSGVVVVDALTTREAAEATLRLYRKHRGNRPVRAVVFTHLPGVRASDASATIELSQSTFRDLLLRRIEFLPALTEGKIRFEGDPGVLREFFGLFEEVTATFPIVGERPTQAPSHLQNVS